MKQLRYFALMFVVTLSGLLQAQSPPKKGPTPVSDREKLIGAWHLVSLENQDPDGKADKIECCGMFVFTRDGHMSVQVMRPEPPKQTPAAFDQFSRGGYEATFGSYQINERAHTFTIHIEGALARPLIGKDLPRAYEFSGQQLIVKSTNPDDHWRVVWEHY
jgi:hypothetical protein